MGIGEQKHRTMTRDERQRQHPNEAMAIKLFDTGTADNYTVTLKLLLAYGLTAVLE
jgi:hypothetical protein